MYDISNHNFLPSDSKNSEFKLFYSFLLFDVKPVNFVHWTSIPISLEIQLNFQY